MNEDDTNVSPPRPRPLPDPPPQAEEGRVGLEALVERWWADHFPGSPVAQVTRAWNHAFAAKEELKRRLQNFTSEA